MTRGSSRALMSMGVISLGVCAWWAFKPLPDIAKALPTFEAAAMSPTPAPQRVAKLDLEPFHAPLWVAPPPPPPPLKPDEPERPAAPPPPMKYQLLAVFGLENTAAPSRDLRAALYDPDADCILVVRVGEPIGVAEEKAGNRRTPGRGMPVLEQVNADGVVIRDASGNLRTLALRTDEVTKR